jgi:monovalent cation:H+ antiporter-2, CPA2 family
VITVDVPNAALAAITQLSRTCPQVPVIARARDIETSARLRAAGAVHAYPETIEASLRLGATALSILQVPSPDVDQLIQGVRDRGYKPVLADEKTPPSGLGQGGEA